MTARTMKMMLSDKTVFVRTDVAGAPVRMGQRVAVLCSDDDDSADERFHGCRGEVVGLLYDDPATQLPANPLVLVAVDGLGEEWFFLNELHAEPARHVIGRAERSIVEPSAIA
ncbi:MAG: Carotenogenesis protein CarS [Myxococcaceae bacterium]|nr:Carotenogenesis protein CarS [Myxococcaceae bacterium]